MLKKALFTFAALVALASFAHAQDKAIEYAKSQTLKVCTRMTVGQLIARSVEKPIWRSGTSSTGDTVVEVTGTIGSGRERMSFFTQFKLNPKQGGFTTTIMKLDGRSLSHPDILDVYKMMCNN